MEEIVIVGLIDLRNRNISLRCCNCEKDFLGKGIFKEGANCKLKRVEIG